MRILPVSIIITVMVISILVHVPAPAVAVSTGGVDSPSNIWAPYGPFSPNLRLSYYSSETTEFQDFELGKLDLTDWPVATASYGSYDGNPDFALSPGEGQFGMFGVDFNYASSTWASWGCDWAHGNSACGIEIREAFAHLIDRTSFVNSGPLQGAGQGLADPSPPAKTPSASSISTQVAWDSLTGQTIEGLTHPADSSAFNIAPSPSGFAQPGSPDSCAARDHLIAANIGLHDLNQDCVIDGNSPGLANIINHPIRFMIRSDDPIRRALGLGLANAINQVFGVNAVVPTLGSIAQLRPLVFISAPEGVTDDWDVYTSGWNLGGPFPDHLRPLYGSTFASDQCGGAQNAETNNYGFLCVSSFDTYANAASQTADVQTFSTQTLAAFNQFGLHVGSIPVYSRGIRTAALRTLAGAVDQRGQGFSNPWTLLSGHNNTAYTPSNPLFKFGGGQNMIRWGQRQGTSQLNPFKAETLWEFNLIGEVYDTLFAASPIEPANVMCWMCDNYQLSVDSQGNTHFLVELRQNLRWQDGVPLNASDVKFTLLNFRDVPAANLVANVQLVLSVTILASYLLDIKMQGQSISHIINLASVPIIPRHIWELTGDKTYGDVGKADPAKTSTSYDMLSSGTFIGSGPFMCRSVFAADFGKVGTGCASNSDGSRSGQALGVGATVILQAYDLTSQSGNVDPFLQYMRSYNTAWGTGTGAAAQSGQFQEFSWADRYDNGTVTIRDLASVASCYGKTDSTGCLDYSYWLRPAFHPGTPTTIGSEITIVSSHLDDAWVYPFSWSGVQSKQPGQTLENIVPFTP